MKHSLYILLLCIGIMTSYAQNQTDSPYFNFDFEDVKDDKPQNWKNFGNSDEYELALDGEQSKNGKYSATIEYKKGDVGFRAWSFTIPNSYPGKEITLTGFIKTENVTDGFAGLWLRIDPRIAFDNMKSQGIKGTTDWTKYSITLKMDPKNTERIVLGGLLVGKGKIWIDNLEVTIDGKKIEALQPLPKKEYLADKDKEFIEGSKIASIPTNKESLTNLKHLGLIWGFLKYYHPAIARGEFNWDYELFRILPKINAATTAKDRDQILVKWINTLGKVKSSKGSLSKMKDAKIQPDLDWITTAGFSSKLSDLLLKIRDAKKEKEHYYIDFVDNVGNPVFKNENPYAENEYPDTGTRLLALFRYWNMIQYYFPYKNLIEEDWKNVLEEFIPKVIEATDKEAYTLTMLEVIARIHDTHANIWGRNNVLQNYKGKNFAAVEVTFIEEKAVVTDFFDEEKGKETGLKIGDIITSVNGKSVETIVEESLKRTPASNYATQLRDIASDLLRTNEDAIKIEFQRENESTTQKATLGAYSTKDINIYSKYSNQDTCFKMIDENIAYLNNGSLKRNYIVSFWDKIKSSKGLIIDIRNYPSDFPIYALSGYLMNESIPFVKFTTGSLETPGLFSVRGKPLTAGKKNKASYDGKVVILVNETSQSSAEFHTMAYQVHPNATVIGSTTAAADGNVSRIALPGGISTMISGIGVYYPDGTETQRVGVAIDLEIKPTIAGVRAGKDELMERAIEIINQ